jgi:hypothetical protein
MNRREQKLLLAVLAIIAGYGLVTLVNRALLRPLDAQQTQVAALKKDVASKRRQMDEALKDRAELAEWEKSSLPGDVQIAQGLYQEFLLQLMKDCRIDEGVLTAGKTQRGKYFTRVPFTITGKTSLENVTDFLYRFYQPDLLHQIRSATIRRTREGSGGRLDVTLVVEGLAMHSAPAREELIDGDRRSSGQLLAGAPRETFQLISRKNIFEPYRDPPPPTRPSPPPTREPEPDAARYVHYTGFTQSGDGPEAWLYNRLTNESRVVRPGDSFDFGGIKATVTHVVPSEITIESDSKTWNLRLGKSLRDMQAARGTAPVADAPATNGAAVEAKEPAKEKDEPAGP